MAVRFLALPLKEAVEELVVNVPNLLELGEDGFHLARWQATLVEHARDEHLADDAQRATVRLLRLDELCVNEDEDIMD